MATKVLVVDDDQDIREMIMIVLESEGFEVFGLDNGAAVLPTVQDNKPNVVLLDVQLGEQDGRDICREMKQIPTIQEIPIIMISANSGWHAFGEKECRPDDFLAKPFDILELIDHVRRFAA